LALLATAAAQADPAVELAPVEVQAQRKLQDERDVPLSLTVLDAERLQDARLSTVDDLSRYAANTQFSKNQLFIRGIGTGANFGFDPSVALFVDGVYLGRGTAALMPFWDLQQVEVIRGPQGTLLGKNTIGGAVNLRTAAPQEGFGGTLAGVHGSLDPLTLRAAADLPLGSDWAMRVSALTEELGGYVDNSTRGEETLGRRNQGLRTRLQWQPEGDWSGWLGLEYNRGRLRHFGSQLSAATPESLALYRLFDPRTEARLDDYRSSTDMEGSGAARRAASATLNLEWGGDGLRLTSLSNVSGSCLDYDYDADYSPIPLLTLGLDEDYRQWSQELRLDGRHASGEYLLGAYLLRADLGVDSRITALPGGAAVVLGELSALPPLLAPILDTLRRPGLPDPVSDQSRKRFRQEATSLALFGQWGWRFAPRWELAAGLRWTQERKAVRMRQSFEDSGLLFRALLEEQAYEASTRRREDDWSPRLVLQYRPDERVTGYLLAARGFKGGGYNDLASRADRLEFEPERAATLEGGFKTLWQDRRLALNLNLFDSRVKNLQVNAFDGSSFYVQNAAAARLRGAELETRWRLGRGWSTQASLGWLDARYRSFPNAPARADQSGDSQDLGGQRLSRAPAASGALGLEYTAVLGGGWGWRAAADVLHRERSFLSLDNDPADAQPAVTTLNAQFGLSSAAGGWALALEGRNLTDELVRNAATDVSLFSGNHWAELDPPRRWSLTLAWRW
jgi:iron complex outermembrane receptor protein